MSGRMHASVPESSSKRRQNLVHPKLNTLGITRPTDFLASFFIAVCTEPRDLDLNRLEALYTC